MTDPANPALIQIAPHEDRWRWGIGRKGALAAGHAPTRTAAGHTAEMTRDLISAFNRAAERRV